MPKAYEVRSDKDGFKIQSLKEPNSKSLVARVYDPELADKIVSFLNTEKYKPYSVA